MRTNTEKYVASHGSQRAALRKEDSEMEEIIRKAIKKATSPFNFVYAPTTGALKNLNVTEDGDVVIKEDVIIVPVDVFMFSCFKSYKSRVVLNRSDLSVKQIIN